MSADDLIEHVRTAFALGTGTPARMSPAGRGALGQIHRLDIGSRSYAVKELFTDEMPAAAAIEAEVAFVARAAAAGVRVAESRPARDGGYVVQMPDGSGWLRVYDWLDADSLDLGTAGLPGRLGTLVGRLHRCAQPTDREPDGSPPDEWYDVPPALAGWADRAGAASAAGAAWAADLAARLPMIAAISALAVPAEPGTMVTCHRDLHPENVLAVGEELAVVDWDDLGPAVPGRELARIALDWFFDHDVLDSDAVSETLAAYRAAGGPGRITASGFGFVIASRLNFLHRQIGIALDGTAEDRHRAWAAGEIDEALRILPTPDVLARLVDLDADQGAADQGVADQGA